MLQLLGIREDYTPVWGTCYNYLELERTALPFGAHVTISWNYRGLHSRFGHMLQLPGIREDCAPVWGSCYNYLELERTALPFGHMLKLPGIKGQLHVSVNCTT